jgi:hypothetical protein
MDAVKKMSPDKQFEIIMKHLSKIPSHTERAGIALQLFGRAGTELLPMIANGAQGFDELMQKAEETGSIMEEKNVRAAENFNDQLTMMSSNIKSMVGNSGLLTWLSEVAEKLNAVATASDKAKNAGVTDNSRMSYQGGVSGFMANLYEGWFGESEGKAFTMTAAPFDRKTERKRRVKVAESKKENERQLAIEKADKKEIKKEDEVNKFDAIISKMKEKLRLQNLITSGRKKEAEAEKAIHAAESKLGRNLTDDERVRIIATSNKMYDTRKKPQSLEPMKQDTKVRVSRAGLILGKGARDVSQSMDVQRNNLLQQIARHTRKSAEKNIDISGAVIGM